MFEFQEFTPFFLVQLNKRILLSGELIFAPSGVSLGQAQADIFINDWLMMDIGHFLAPIGFWNERLDPEWINKLPDQPLVLRQVIPDGLTLTGLQFRGGKYLFGSPVKMEYSVYATDALGVPGMGLAADWSNLGGVIGTTANINQGMTYGGRLGFGSPPAGSTLACRSSPTPLTSTPPGRLPASGSPTSTTIMGTGISASSTARITSGPGRSSATASSAMGSIPSSPIVTTNRPANTCNGSSRLPVQRRPVPRDRSGGGGIKRELVRNAHRRAGRSQPVHDRSELLPFPRNNLQTCL